MDRQTAEQLMQALKNHGFSMKDGLSDAQFSEIEKVYKAVLPPDLRLLLSVGVPVAYNGKFPDWHGDIQKIYEDKQEYIVDRFKFDIENNEYWHPLLGEKPDVIEDAKGQAAKVVRSWPPLIPLYAHRFLPSSPVEAGNPVLSVWQPVDTIYYGYDLVSYFNNEFKLKLPPVSTEEYKRIPYWSDVFELGEW